MFTLFNYAMTITIENAETRVYRKTQLLSLIISLEIKNTSLTLTAIQIIKTRQGQQFNMTVCGASKNSSLEL